MECEMSNTCRKMIHWLIEASTKGEMLKRGWEMIHFAIKVESKGKVGEEWKIICRYVEIASK